MNKKKENCTKNFQWSLLIIILFIIIDAMFGFIIDLKDKDKFYCAKNPDKCVCEIYITKDDYSFYSNNITAKKLFPDAICGKKFRFKPQADLYNNL